MMPSDVRGADLLLRMILLQACLHLVAARDILFNMESDDCVRTSVAIPAVVGVIDRVYLTAMPIQVGDTQTRAICRITLLGTEGKKLKIHIREIIFRECGVFLRIYDGDQYFLHPKWSFSCNQGAAGGLYFTTDSKVTISLEKPSSDNKLYQFSIVVAREDGPDINGSLQKPAGQTYNTGLTVGAQAGIGIGVMLVFLINQ